MRSLAWVCLFVSAGCASGPEPIPAPALGAPSQTELFRRARFFELSGGDPARVSTFAAELYTKGSFSRTADLAARASYRRGDARSAQREISGLPNDNRTKRLLEALLAHADASQPLRESSIRRGLIRLPLRARALDRGYPVIEAHIGDQTFGLLWDTGANENVLDPRALEALGLPSTDVQFILPRGDDALVVRATATATPEVELGLWRLFNVPWLVAELDTIAGMKREVREIDGFLSPQLLLPQGCFEIDRLQAILTVGFDRSACRHLIEQTAWRAPIYSFDGEIYASARVHQSPEIAVQVETGSPVTFLRSDASRYLPLGILTEPADDGDIAHRMKETVGIRVAGRAKSLSAIDLEPRRRSAAYDDVATVGNDLLLQGRGIVISFEAMQIGSKLLPGQAAVMPVDRDGAAAQPIALDQPEKSAVGALTAVVAED